MKFFAALLAAVLCLVLGVAVAEPVNTVPQVGDQIAGFTVTSVSEYAPLDATVVCLTHDKTGGPVMWIANDDTERSFQIGFRTHYDTDTGVPHVFEHAALSGSEKYPDPALFFNMMSNTCQTYLNASTYTYMTVYPCSSISDKQLLKFADIYLSGVFEPLVLTDIHAMEREAYRYEMADADSELTLTGTVYSEMLGSYYAREAEYETARVEFPGSWYATCTGGQPGVIENMTQQDLIDFHDTYYQPSNALTILYGDLNLEDFLTLIDSYYSRYEKTDVSTADPGYTPFTGANEKTLEVCASEDAAADTELRYIMPIRGLEDNDVHILSSIISDTIDNTSSALYNIMMERFPSSSFSLSLEYGGAEPMLSFKLAQAGDTTPDEFVAAVQEGIAGDLEEGIHYDLLNAELKQTKIATDRIRENTEIGVAVGTSVMELYTLTGDLNSYFECNNTILNDMDNWIGSGIIEKVLSEQVVNPEDYLLLTINKVPGLTEQKEAEAKQKLADKRAAMTDEEVAEVVASTKEYNEWTESMSEVSMINEVNVLTVEELPEEVRSADVSVVSENGVRYISSALDNCNTVTLEINLRADMIPADQLQAYAFAVSNLGVYATSKHTQEEIETLTTEYGISFSSSTITDQRDPDLFAPVVSVLIDCLAEDLPNALALTEEILTDTAFDEYDLIRYNDTVDSEYYKMAYSQYAPHYLCLAFASAASSDAGLYSYYTTSMPYYQYLANVAEMDDNTIATEAETWRTIVASLIDRNQLQCTIVASEENIASAREQIAAMTDTWPLTSRTAVDYASVLEKLPKRIAITIPGSTTYNIQMVSASDAGYNYTPDMSIMRGLVYDQLLIPTMRYNNGVYSVLSSIDESSAYILAYRDPSLTTTYDEVIPSLSAQVSSIELTDEELANLVVSAYTKIAIPSGPLTTAEVAVYDVLCNCNTPATTLEEMAAYKQATKESVLANASVYDALAEKGAIVSAAPASMINANKDRFDLVISWFVE